MAVNIIIVAGTVVIVILIFLMWIIKVLQVLNNMPDKKIKESGDFFKKVLPFINLTTIISFFNIDGIYKKQK